MVYANASTDRETVNGIKQSNQGIQSSVHGLTEEFSKLLLEWKAGKEQTTGSLERVETEIQNSMQWLSDEVVVDLHGTRDDVKSAQSDILELRNENEALRKQATADRDTILTLCERVSGLEECNTDLSSRIAAVEIWMKDQGTRGNSAMDQGIRKKSADAEDGMTGYDIKWTKKSHNKFDARLKVLETEHGELQATVHEHGKLISSKQDKKQLPKHKNAEGEAQKDNLCKLQESVDMLTGKVDALEKDIQCRDDDMNTAAAEVGVTLAKLVGFMDTQTATAAQKTVESPSDAQPVENQAKAKPRNIPGQKTGTLTEHKELKDLKTSLNDLKKSQEFTNQDVKSLSMKLDDCWQALRKFEGGYNIGQEFQKRATIRLFVDVKTTKETLGLLACAMETQASDLSSLATACKVQIRFPDMFSNNKDMQELLNVDKSEGNDKANEEAEKLFEEAIQNANIAMMMADNFSN
jgi:hypothetical protein